MRPRFLRLSLLVVGIFFAHGVSVRGETIFFQSDTSWNVSDASHNPVGTAEYVVLNSTYPTRRPPGAINYNFAGAGWTADLTPIPNAYWIYAPGINQNSPNANLSQYTFSQTVSIAGTPEGGTIWVAVDDFAQIYVNGNFVGSWGSVTDISAAGMGNSQLEEFSIPGSFLNTGPNLIQVMTQDGPESFSGFPNATYGENPAGVVFGGDITTVPEPSSLALVGAACGSLWLVRRSRRLFARR